MKGQPSVVDISLVRTPKNIVSTLETNLQKDMYIDMMNSDGLKKHPIVVVTDEKGFVAVDRIYALLAARKAKKTKVSIISIGKLDPQFMHIEMSVTKEMINPIRVCLAMRSLDEKLQLKLKSNSYYDSVFDILFRKKFAAPKDGESGEAATLQNDPDYDVLLSLANGIDTIFAAGILQPPPQRFFSLFFKLDCESQMNMIERTVEVCKMMPKKFIWPDSAIFKILLQDHEEKPTPPVRESASKGVPHMQCKCGESYGLINDEICKLEEKDGCMIVRDRVGNSVYSVPPKDAKFIGAYENDDVLKFSRHKSLADLKKTKITGPFLIVTLDDKKV